MKIKYITEVSAQRYKNLNLDTSLKLSEGLNIFIGSNGSGKSNFLVLLKFLKSSLSGKFTPEKSSPTSFVEAVVELNESRMLNADITYPEKVNLTFNFVAEDNSHENCLSLWLSILCSDAKHSQIAEEHLSYYYEDDPNWRIYFYHFHSKSTGNGLIQRRYKNSIVSHHITGIPTDEIGLSVIPRLVKNSENLPSQGSVYIPHNQIIDFTSNWMFYDSNSMNLKSIRNAEPEIGSPEKYLNSDCENLALVLDNLIQESIDFEEQINVIMRDIVPQTKRIRPIRTGRTRISIEWHLQNTKRPLYLDEMSDGTVRMLCWAIILNSPNLPSLIVIDEPEVGLHVQWLSYLAEWIKNAAARTQVIITTHSPDLLDKFTDCLENVHVFEASNPEKTLFHVKTLSRERLQTHLDEGWELGDLYRVGDPEVGGWAL